MSGWGNVYTPVIDMEGPPANLGIDVSNENSTPEAIKREAAWLLWEVHGFTTKQVAGALSKPQKWVLALLEGYPCP